MDLLFPFILGNLEILMWDNGSHPQVPIHSCKLEASVSRPSRLLWRRTNAASWLLRHFSSSNGSKVAMKACTDNCDWISCWKRKSNVSCSYSSDTSFESLRVLFHLETCEKPRRWPWTKNVKQQAHIKVQTCLAHGYHLGLVPAWLPIWAPSIEASAAKSIITPGRRLLAESLAHSTLVRCGREKGQDDRIFNIKKERRIQNHWTFLCFMGLVGVM